MATDTLVISIWLVDPVGGELVDWPEDTDDAYICNKNILEIALQSISKSKNCRLLKEILESLPDAWISHSQLGAIENELQTAIALASRVHSENSELLRRSYEKILKACRFARSLDSAGIYIG